MPHGIPLPADAAHVHGDRARGPLSDHRHPAPDAGHSAQQPMGDLPAQPRRTDAGDGDVERARLPVGDLCGRPPRAAQSRHPPQAVAAARARPKTRRADELPAVLHAGHAGDLLRRRDRHGRQHPSRRPRRRAHADAVVARPQRRILARGSLASRAAADHGPAVRLRGGERRGAIERPAFAAELDAPGDCGAPPVPCIRARQLPAALSEEPKGPCVSARVRRPHDPLRGQSGAHAAGGGARAVGVRRADADRAGRRLDLSTDRPAQLSADAAALRLLLVPFSR